MEDGNQHSRGRPWKDKINFNTLLALFFLLFSITFYILIPYQIEKPKLFMGRALDAMEPTVFPRISLLFLFAMSVWYLIFSFYFTEENLFKKLGAKAYVRVLITLLIAVAYTQLFEPLGFVISGILAVSALTIFFGNRNFLVIGIVGVGVPVSVYFIFTRLLKVSLPEFPFF
jgi:putative tricarboxylic transport membrane protein